MGLRDVMGSRIRKILAHISVLTAHVVTQRRLLKSAAQLRNGPLSRFTKHKKPVAWATATKILHLELETIPSKALFVTLYALPRPEHWDKEL